MKMKNLFSVANTIVALLIAGLAFSPASAQPADLVVTNARVWTARSLVDEATAFAVRDGRFVAVGSAEDVQPLVGPRTTVYDAGGRRVTPGLIDTHLHIENGAGGFGRLDLRPATSRQHMLELIRAHAATLPEGEWVLGRGWSAESWPDVTTPTPAEIDAATGGRPAILTRMDGHSLIAGGEAIRRAGITKDGPADPLGGKIGRRPGGEPDGAFYEQAMGLVTRNVPRSSPERVREQTRQAVRHLNSLGLTQVGAIDTRGFVESHLVPLDNAGDLTIRVGVSITGAGDTMEAWRPVLRWASDIPDPSPNVRVLGFKGYMDGSLGSRTAWMLEGFTDEPDNAGFPLAMAATGALGRLILEAGALGLQPAVHAIGDRANRQLLNWYQAMGPTGWETRPRVEHAQHVDPADIPRFVRMGVIPSMQPYHKADDGRYAEERLGPERIRTSYAFRDFYDSGALLAFGSDWPVVSADPFLGIHAAVTARTITGDLFVPAQSLTVPEALTCYTVHGSWTLKTQNEAGMIEPGRLADFIVLDRDILRVDPELIKDTRVLRTYVGGEMVFERAPGE